MTWQRIFSLEQVAMRETMEIFAQQGMEPTAGYDALGCLTVRMQIPVNVHTDRLRLVFQNLDREPALLSDMTLAKCGPDGKLLPDTLTRVTCGGSAAMEVAPGVIRRSDPIALALAPGDVVAVSALTQGLLLSSSSVWPMMSHTLGSHTREDFEHIDITPEPMKAMGYWLEPKFPLLAGLEAEVSQPTTQVLCFGDSITQQGYWFVPLMEGLYKKFPGQVCLHNGGISGNRLTRHCPASMGRLFGPSGLSRFAETAEACGANWLIFALGINDLNFCAEGTDTPPGPTAEEFGAGCRQIADTARQMGIHSLAFTLYPADLEQPPEREALRKELFADYNRAILAAGFDEILDLSAILADPQTGKYYPHYAQADGLHLNAQGGLALAQAILSRLS